MQQHPTALTSSVNFKIIGLVWLILTAININKAYHIDDTFHLEAAYWIIENPTSPMTGEINWEDSPAPIYTFNQPPLFFYIIAATISIFGDSEIILHLMLSLFTFTVLYYFYKIALLLKVKQPHLLFIVFSFSPALIVNQNLMVDIPLLSLCLAVIYFIFKGIQSNNSLCFIKASILFSIALLIKYSILPLFVILIYSLFISKNKKNLLAILIPLLTLILWSVWNKNEFNQIHISGRDVSGFNIYNLIGFFGTIGSIATFIFFFLRPIVSMKVQAFIFLLAILFFSSSAILVYYDFIDEDTFEFSVNKIFIASGIILFGLIVYHFIKNIKNSGLEYLRSLHFILFLTVLAFSSFFIRFAPFQATRHLLLIIPFILLFGHATIDLSSNWLRTAVPSITIFLGLALGISDWQTANFYRKTANNLKLDSDNIIWSKGHWGWQWYATKNGMETFSLANDLNLKSGEIIVAPQDIARQNLSMELKTENLKTIIDTPSIFTFFSGKSYASLYTSFDDKPVWTFSKKPIDTIRVDLILEEFGVEHVINSYIKPNEGWFNSIKQKAKEKNITIDSMLHLDAQWLINQKRKQQ